ncbi:hypothetical protein [Spirosoma koreense]
MKLIADPIPWLTSLLLVGTSPVKAQSIHERQVYVRVYGQGPGKGFTFITHQYLHAADALIQTLNKAVAGALIDCVDNLKEQYYQSRQATASLVGQVSRRAAVSP